MVIFHIIAASDSEEITAHLLAYCLHLPMGIAPRMRSPGADRILAANAACASLLGVSSAHWLRISPWAILGDGAGSLFTIMLPLADESASA